MPTRDRFSHIDSTLRRWDARWKLTTAGVFIASTIILHQLTTAVAACALALGLVAVGRLPVLGVCRRLRPIVIVVLVIAAMLTFTGGGERAYVVGLAVSGSGLYAAGLVAAKALAIVLALMALVSTSPAQSVLGAMRQLHLPAGLVQVLHLAYRYIFVIQTESRAVQTAMRARAFCAGLNGRSLALIGNVVGMLLIRSTERAERVYLAMQARGFDGSFPTSDRWSTTASDVIKFSVLSGISLAIVAVDNCWQ